MRQLRKIIAVVILVAVLFFARTGYLLVRPGSAEDLSQIIKVASQEGKNKGSFYLVTVSQQHASPILLLYAMLHPIVDLQSRQSVIPPDMDPQKYQNLMNRWMEESQNLARVIALRKLGYDVPILSDGVEVVEIGEDSPTKDILLAGDVIVEVDGATIYLAEELITKVQERAIGEAITLTIMRNNERKTVNIDTTSHTDHPDKAALRILIQTLNWQPVLPLEIDIEVGEISGPSAGMMFVLEILNQLNPQDLTSGYQIAGTGTINLRGEVGPIGGVRQKVRAAENSGAMYFLVPQDNYEEAKTAVREITLVPVKTLDEVLQYLEELATESDKKTVKKQA